MRFVPSLRTLTRRGTADRNPGVWPALFMNFVKARSFNAAIRLHSRGRFLSLWMMTTGAALRAAPDKAYDD